MHIVFHSRNSKSLITLGILFLILLIGSCFFYLKNDIRHFFRQRSPDVFEEKKLAKGFDTSFVVNIPEEIFEVFSVPFTYLGSGTQAVAFEDVSKTHVLKIFLFDQIKGAKKIPQFSIRKLFPSHRKKMEKIRFERKKRSLLKTLTAYDHVFQNHPEIAALEAAHLSKKECLLPLVSVIDPAGKRFVLNLNDLFFVVQKKANLVLSTLQDRSLEDQKKFLDSMQTFLIQRAKLGYIDLEKELQMHMNYGFVDNFAIQLDVGALVEDTSPIHIENEVQRVLEKFANWKKIHEFKD